MNGGKLGILGLYVILTIKEIPSQVVEEVNH